MLLVDERINSTLTCKGNKTAVIALIQRVTEACVRVDGVVIGEINRGLLALIAVQPDDTEQRISRMVERILTYRVFPDDEDRMNQSILDQSLELLAVPQFTLAADTRKGTRPSFTRAAAPDKGREFFGLFLDRCQERLPTLASGQFGANMQVALVNDGPVTFWLEC